MTNIINVNWPLTVCNLFDAITLSCCVAPIFIHNNVLLQSQLLNFSFSVLLPAILAGKIHTVSAHSTYVHVTDETP